MRFSSAVVLFLSFWLVSVSSYSYADTSVTPTLSPWSYRSFRCEGAVTGTSEPQVTQAGIAANYSNHCGVGTVDSVGNPWTDETSYAWGCGVIKYSDYQAGLQIYSHKDIKIRYPQLTWDNQCTNTTTVDSLFLNKNRVLSCPPGSYFNGEVCIFPTANEMADKNDCPDCMAVYGNGSDPIHSGTGFSYQTETDFTAPGSMLRFDRFYTSATHREPTNLGKNWRHTYDRSLLAVTSNDVGVKTAVVLRPGSGREYFTLTGGLWASATDINTRLVQLGDSTWIYTDKADTQEHFSKTGQLLSITDKNGRVLTMQYEDDLLDAVIDDAGRSLSLVYTYFDSLAGVPATRLTSVGLPDGRTIRYQYDANGFLERAIYPDETPLDDADNPFRRYQYGDGTTAQNYQMIGLFDERGIQYANWQFDGAGRAISSEHGSPGSDINKVSFIFNSGTSTTITNQYGHTRNVTFTTVKHTRKISGMSAPCPSCPGNFAARTYDANGQVDIETDFDGTTTDVDYNSRGLITQKIESANKPVTKRTTQTTWHASFNVPTERNVLNHLNTLEAKTKYAYNARGQLTATCQIDPSVSAAMSYVCGSSVNAPVGVRQTATTYCEQADINNNACPLLGLMIATNGPRTDAATDITILTYYQTDDASCAAAPTSCPHRKGDLWKVTNPLNHIVEFTKYDGAGRALRIKDANNVIIDMEYSARGWLTARKVRGLDDSDEFYDDAITRFSYDAAGQVTRATQADGHLMGDYINFTYDAGHRLTKVSDAENNYITYQLDDAGSREIEKTYDPNDVLTRKITRVFDSLGRIEIIKNAALGIVTTLTYDDNNNIETDVDGLNRLKDNDHDPLNRLTKTIQNFGGLNVTTQYFYDSRNNLTKVADPKALNTLYTYNGLNDLTQIVSPDTGTTAYTYDAAGNRKTQLDQKGKTTTYSYDGLNRLILQSYNNPALNSSFAYDTVNAICGVNESFAKGHLTQLTDPSSGTPASISTQYCYDRFGHMTKKQITNNGIVSTFVFNYSRGGRLTSTTYPSGMIVSYVRNKANQIIQVNVNQGVSTKIYANNITYYPFGPLSRIEFLPPGSSGGNPGVTAPGGAEAGGGCIPQPGGGCSPPPPSNPVIQTRVYDLDYAVDSIGGLDYTVDVIGRISSIVDAAGGNTYEYDNMDRLTKVKDSDTLADAMAFTYDATGNRMSKKNGALALEAYTYDAGNHRLKTVAGQTRSYDANGNTIQTATNKRFTFDDRNRYVDYRTGNPTNSIQNQYQYNAKGDRVRKYKDAVDHARYTYGENGQILVIEKIAGGVTTTQEILWLDDMPIGVSQNGTLHGILTDHLMSPRSVFEISTQKTVWRWDMADDAFGENALNIAEDPDANGILFKFDMRFPGQIADAETGFNYNYFRDFEPTTGRYIQSDPIGLKGGLSTYAYVTSKPLQYVDRHGLSPTIPCDGGNGVTLCDGKGGFETFNCNRDKCTRACTQMHENQHKLDFQLLMPNACQGIPRGRDPETALLPKKPGTNEDFYDYSNWMECRGAAAALNCAQNKCDCDTSRYKQKQINVLIGKNCAQYGISPESAEKYQW